MALPENFEGTNVNHTFSHILIQVQAITNDFVNKLYLLDDYKRQTEVEPFHPTPGIKMMYEAKKLRVQEIPNELEHMKTQILRGSQKLSDLLPSLPKEVDYKAIKSDWRTDDLWKILMKQAIEIEKSVKDLKGSLFNNPWSKSETEVICESLTVLVKSLFFCLKAVLTDDDISEIRKDLENGGQDVLCQDEIDSLLVSWDNLDIDLSELPEISEDERYNAAHGIDRKPNYGHVHVMVETWLAEKYDEWFDGWAYAQHYIKSIKNKKIASLTEVPDGRYPWISRAPEYHYDFDGETIKETIEHSHIIRGFENEEYLGPIPPDIPKDIGWRKHEIQKALTILETAKKDCICEFKFIDEELQREVQTKRQENQDIEVLLKD